MAASRPGSTASRDAIPQIPHTAPSLVWPDERVRRAGRAPAARAARRRSRVAPAVGAAPNPVSDPARARRARARLRARGSEPRPAAGGGPRRCPPASPLLGCLQHRPARAAAEPAVDLATRRGTRGRDDGGRCSSRALLDRDRKSTRLNSSHTVISYAVFCLKKKKKKQITFKKKTNKKNKKKKT